MLTCPECHGGEDVLSCEVCRGLGGIPICAEPGCTEQATEPLHNERWCGDHVPACECHAWPVHSYSPAANEPCPCHCHKDDLPDEVEQ